MDALHSEILKLLTEHGQMHWGNIRNKLNGQPAGWDVRDSDVQGALDRLLKAGHINQDGDRWTSVSELDAGGNWRNPNQRRAGVYRIRINVEREGADKKLLDRFSREILIKDDDVDSLTFGATSIAEFCAKHLHAVMWGMLIRERELREIESDEDSRTLSGDIGGDDFHPEKIEAVANKVVNDLIADAEKGRLKNNKELAEVIAVCIRNTRLFHLLTLKALLEQRDLENPEIQH